MGHTPSTAGTFRKKFRKNSGKTSETLSESFLEFPSRVRLGCPKPYHSRHLRLPEHFQNSLPPQYGWGRLFFQKRFRRGPLRAGHGIPGSTEGISDWGNRSRWFGGSHDRVVAKGVVFSRVPLHRNFLQGVFPCSATLAEESCNFDLPGSPKNPERGHIRQNHPFTKPHRLVSS